MKPLYPWQVATYQQISEAFRLGRGHHALLFKTDTGLGTERLIRQLARWLLCQTPAANEPCGQCQSCRLIQAESHPDLHLLAPIEGKDIGVDQVRDISQRLQQFPQQGGNAVVYLQGAEKLTEAASNALLKTLEEPPQNSYFLLEAPLQTAMLPTIQSRCQTWLIQAPDSAEALAWLAEQCPDASEEERETALRLCHQRPLESKNFLDFHRLPARKTFLQTFWRFYKSRDLWLLFSVFDKEADGALQQLEWLDSFFADALKCKLGVQSGWLNPDLAAGIVPFSQQLSALKLLKGHQIVQQTAQDIRQVNAVNLELMLLNALSQLALEVFE